jgi:hypothetical protein
MHNRQKDTPDHGQEADVLVSEAMSGGGTKSKLKRIASVARRGKEYAHHQILLKRSPRLACLCRLLSSTTSWSAIPRVPTPAAAR